MFVKICGITRRADAVAAVDAGADAVGLNFVPWSRRCIEVETARSILAVVPDDVLAVGIFRDHTESEVCRITDALGLAGAQVHGDTLANVSPADLGVSTVIRVVTVEGQSISAVGEGTSDIVMLDAPGPGGGVPFDWAAVGDLVTRHRILIAGGLRPDNVAEAVRRVRPWGVDVASGVETRPGQKDPGVIARFVAAARAAADVPAET